MAYGTSQGSTYIPKYPTYKPTVPKPSYSGSMTSAFNPFPGKTADDQANYGYAPTVPSGPTYGSGYAQGPDFSAPRGHMVTPDFSGILGAFSADERNRFGAGLEAKKAETLSAQRALINRLGVRDVPGMLGKLSQYGFTQADLQQAADNPWSELKALDYNANHDWLGKVGRLGSQGLYRSGATVDARDQIDLNKARQEAGMTTDVLGGLSEARQGLTNWEREGRDNLERSIAAQQSSLAAAYQPYWVQD